MADVIRQRFNANEVDRRTLNQMFSAKRSVYNYFIPFLKQNTEVSHDIIIKMCEKLIETDSHFVHLKKIYKWIWAEALYEAHEYSRECRKNGEHIIRKELIPLVDTLTIPRDYIEVKDKTLGIKGTTLRIHVEKMPSLNKKIESITIDRRDGNKKQFVVIKMVDSESPNASKESFSLADIISDSLYVA